MLRIADKSLPAASEAFLDRLQGMVDALAARPDQISKAKSLFDRRRGLYKHGFDPIIQMLSEMAPPFRRCYYCEDSEHRDVEHIRPKRHYPDLCFKWKNYAFACPICNGAKSDTVGIFTGGGNVVSLFKRTHPIDTPLPPGDHALIDPREDDPLDFLKLDLRTGFMAPMATDGRAFERAKYTIAVLKLNRDAILRNRLAMIKSYMMYLEFYEANVGEPDKAKRILREILNLPQPTVFAELKRQRDSYGDVKHLIEVLPKQYWSVY